MNPTPSPGVSYEQVYAALAEASPALFGADPRVRAVGVSQSLDAGFALGVIRNTAAVQPLEARASVQTGTFLDFDGIPVRVFDAAGDPTTLARLPARPQDRPRAGTRVPERSLQRPLVSGLEIQNIDDDLRCQLLPDHVTVGTLGAFVRLGDGRVAILSNNHVLARENRGKRGRDRIVQPGTDKVELGATIAILHDYARLQTSSQQAHISNRNVNWNRIDAAVAFLVEDTDWAPRYLPTRRRLLPFLKWSPVHLGDSVLKVGRTTGLTQGTVAMTALEVGPVGYDFGPCWFRQCFAVLGVKGKPFSAGGDSGSLIVKPGGEVVGLLFAGDGTHSYACPIAPVLSQFGCTLATLP